MLRALIVGGGLATAVGAFALTHGVEKHQQCRSNERASSLLVQDLTWAFPIGGVAVGLLCLTLIFITRNSGSFSYTGAYFVGIGNGGIAGFIFSILIWLCLGGWGPPFLLPSIVAGSVLAAALVAARRWGRRIIKAQS